MQQCTSTHYQGRANKTGLGWGGRGVAGQGMGKESWAGAGLQRPWVGVLVGEQGGGGRYVYAQTQAWTMQTK